MTMNTVLELRRPAAVEEQAECHDALTELLRQGARKLIKL
jgi:hypothetical protein